LPSRRAFHSKKGGKTFNSLMISTAILRKAMKQATKTSKIRNRAKERQNPSKRKKGK
jgi:hypothetical protein